MNRVMYDDEQVISNSMGTFLTRCSNLSFHAGNLTRVGEGDFVAPLYKVRNASAESRRQHPKIGIGSILRKYVSLLPKRWI